MNNDFIKWQVGLTIIIRTESSLEIWAVFAIISKYVGPEVVAVQGGHKNLNHGFSVRRYADMPQNDDELNLKINSCIKNMSSKKKSSFQCEFCDKICLSNLKRHVTKKHPSSKAQETSSSDCLASYLVLTAEIKEEPLILKVSSRKVFEN